MISSFSTAADVAPRVSLLLCRPHMQDWQSGTRSIEPCTGSGAVSRTLCIRRPKRLDSESVCKPRSAVPAPSTGANHESIAFGGPIYRPEDSPSIAADRRVVGGGEKFNHGRQGDVAHAAGASRMESCSGGGEAEFRYHLLRRFGLRGLGMLRASYDPHTQPGSDGSRGPALDQLLRRRKRMHTEVLRFSPAGFRSAAG